MGNCRYRIPQTQIFALFHKELKHSANYLWPVSKWLLQKQWAPAWRLHTNLYILLNGFDFLV